MMLSNTPSAVTIHSHLTYIHWLIFASAFCSASRQNCLAKPYCRYRGCQFHVCKVTDSSQSHKISQFCQQAVKLSHPRRLAVNSNSRSTYPRQQFACRLRQQSLCSDLRHHDDFAGIFGCDLSYDRGVFRIFLIPKGINYGFSFFLRRKYHESAFTGKI